MAIDSRADPILELLELRSVSDAIVEENSELLSDYIRLWESRGFKVGRKGLIKVTFNNKPLQYIYPLDIRLC